MKSALTLASLSLVYGYAYRRPLKVLMETSPETMDHGVIQDATQSTSIDLPDSYTDSVAIYQYDASSDSLESYLDIVMTESLSTTLNKEKFVISMSVNG